MNTTDLTLEYYNKKADSFVEGTRDVDFSALQNEFASYIKKGGRILDIKTPTLIQFNYSTAACLQAG